MRLSCYRPLCSTSPQCGSFDHRIPSEPLFSTKPCAAVAANKTLTNNETRNTESIIAPPRVYGLRPTSLRTVSLKFTDCVPQVYGLSQVKHCVRSEASLLPSPPLANNCRCRDLQQQQRRRLLLRQFLCHTASPTPPTTTSVATRGGCFRFSLAVKPRVSRRIR